MIRFLNCTPVLLLVFGKSNVTFFFFFYQTMTKFFLAGVQSKVGGIDVGIDGGAEGGAGKFENTPLDTLE